MSGRPGRSRRVRYVGGDREERVEEEESEDYDNIVLPRDQGSGSQEATGDQVVQRAIIVERSILRAAAVCLTALCVLGVLRTTDKVIDYNSAINNLILERDQCKTSYDNMTLDRDQWKTRYDNMTLDRDQWKTSYDNMILDRDQWKTKYNKLCETAVKCCPSGWKTFGGSCYYRTAERKTWEEHRELCLKTGAHLVIIDSKEEQEFIRRLTGGSGSWIGLNRTAGHWTWVDGTPLTTTQYWDSGEPDNVQDWNCAYYSYSRGGWANFECSVTSYGICEK